MDTLLSRISTMAHEYFGPGQLRTDDESRVYWTTKEGVETPLGWSLEEADFRLSALLDARTRRRIDEDES
jgi:hypothetical protein